MFPLALLFCLVYVALAYNAVRWAVLQDLAERDVLLMRELERDFANGG